MSPDKKGLWGKKLLFSNKNGDWGEGKPCISKCHSTVRSLIWYFFYLSKIENSIKYPATFGF